MFKFLEPRSFDWSSCKRVENWDFKPLHLKRRRWYYTRRVLYSAVWSGTVVTNVFVYSVRTPLYYCWKSAHVDANALRYVENAIIIIILLVTSSRVIVVVVVVVVSVVMLRIVEPLNDGPSAASPNKAINLSEVIIRHRLTTYTRDLNLICCIPNTYCSTKRSE